MTRPPVVALGTVSLDTVESGAKTATDVLGGSAPYFGAAARLGCAVELVGVAGSDFPDEYLGRLREAGIGVDGVRRHEGETFRWHVRYERDGSRQTIATNRERALQAHPEMPEELRDPKALFLGSTDPSVQAAVLAAAGAPDFVVLDTMSHWIQDRRADFDLVARSADVVLLNEEEAALLGDGRSEPGIAALLDGGCSWVVVKRGEEGAVAFGHDRAIAVSRARPQVVIDPTGAGDAFAGGLVDALARSWPDRLGMEEALARAAAMGSLAVESFSVDRLLDASPEGAASRAREVRIRVRKHKPGAPRLD